MFWPTEIDQLQSVCAAGTKGKAFSIDTAPTTAGQHSPICARYFGAAYCSCGLEDLGAAIYEADL
jgi:hypothetical protein